MIEERISRFYVVKCKNKRCDMVSVFNTRKEAEEAEKSIGSQETDFALYATNNSKSYNQ